MAYLLDTNAVLMALAEPSRLTKGVSRAILKGPNVLSSVVYWEVVLKSMKGSLDVGDPRTWWKDAMDQLAATPLELRPEHVGEVCSLPPLHKDPFDRVLMAQAIVEHLTFVTSDASLPNYASSRLFILS